MSDLENFQDLVAQELYNKHPEKRDLIYLASPYAAPLAGDIEKVKEARVEATRLVASAMVAQGLLVFAPTVYSHDIFAIGVPPQGWYAWDLEILTRCDHLFILQLPGWRESEGITIEIAVAQAAEMPVTMIPNNDALWVIPSGLEETLELWDYHA